jgi:hypothetical protein
MNWRSREEEKTFETLVAASREFEGKANVEVDAATAEHGVILRLLPHSDDAAPLAAHLDDAGSVSITIGRGLILDVHQGRSDRDEFLAFLADVIRAVGQGRVEETAWLVGDRVVAAKGTLELESGERHRISYRSLWPPSKGTPVAISYQPY